MSAVERTGADEHAPEQKAEEEVRLTKTTCVTGIEHADEFFQLSASAASQAESLSLSLTGGGYELDGSTQPFAVDRQVPKVLREDGTVDSDPLTIRRSAHGPVVAEEQGEAVALRVAGTARPRMLEQFWRMGLARNLTGRSCRPTDAAGTSRAAGTHGARAKRAHWKPCRIRRSVRD